MVFHYHTSAKHITGALDPDSILGHGHDLGGDRAADSIGKPNGDHAAHAVGEELSGARDRPNSVELAREHPEDGIRRLAANLLIGDRAVAIIGADGPFANGRDKRVIDGYEGTYNRRSVDVAVDQQFVDRQDVGVRRQAVQVGQLKLALVTRQALDRQRVEGPGA